jgi:hypothetical protein
MKSFKIIFSEIFALILIGALLAGCATPAVNAEPNPTPDVKIVRTEAASTVVAEFTKVALLAPTETPTPLPPSPTQPEPTATIGATEIPPPTNTPIPVTIIQPTATKHVFLPTIQKSDQVLLIYRTPLEHAKFVRGETFDAIWTIQNTGKKAWNNEYYFSYNNGTRMQYNGDKRFIQGSVKPGERTQVIVDMKAPNNPGVYTTSWVFYNDNGTVFYTFFLTIEVIEP